MYRLVVIVLWALVLAIPAAAQPGVYTSEEAAGFRGQWSLDNWDVGGPLVRYVFLNMTEFWNHSLILRGGPVRPLDEALRPEVAQFVTTTGAGKKPLLDYAGIQSIQAKTRRAKWPKRSGGVPAGDGRFHTLETCSAIR